MSRSGFLIKVLGQGTFFGGQQVELFSWLCYVSYYIAYLNRQKVFFKDNFDFKSISVPKNICLNKRLNLDICFGLKV